MSTERTIEELTRRWLKAAASNDVEAVMALYHPAIRSFDAIFSRCMTSKWKRPIPWRSVTA